MLTGLGHNWSLIVLRGVFAILFGVLALTWPGFTLGALILVWGAYAFADGILALVSAFTGRGHAPWWALLLEGVVSLMAAFAAFFFPGITAVVLLYMIAFWAVATGVLEIIAAIQLRKEIDHELWLGLAGLVSVLFGVLLFSRPLSGIFAVIWMIGAYALVFGILLVALGFRVRRMREVVVG